MRRLTYENEAFDEFTEWATVNKKLFDRIVKLLTEIQRTPSAGTGKPEPLKHEYKDCCRGAGAITRIDQEHRLVYQVTNETITVLSCRDHY